MKQEEGRLQEEDLRLKARPEDSAGTGSTAERLYRLQEAKFR